MGKRVNKRMVVATMYRHNGKHKLTQELCTYRHRTEINDILRNIQVRVNEHYKFQEQHILFIDEKS